MKQLKNLKIGQKLVFSYIIILFLFSVSMSYALVGMSVTSTNMHEFYEAEFRIVQTSESMNANLQGFAKSMARAALAAQNTENRSDSDAQNFLSKKISEAEKFLDAFDDNLETLQTYSLNSKSELTTILEQAPTMSQLSDRALRLYRNGQAVEGLSVSNGDLNACSATISKALNTIISNAQDRAKAKYESAQTRTRSVFGTVIVLTILLVLCTIGLCTALTRSITRPLHEMEDVALALAEGNLSQDIAYRSKDELGTLAHSVRLTVSHLRQYIGELNAYAAAIGRGKLNYHSDLTFQGDFVAIKTSMDDISRNLTHAIVQINTSAEQVMRGSEQIAGSGQALSQATLEQASSVEELGATINDVSDRVTENAENAMETSRLAEHVGAQVIASSEQLLQMKASMNDMQSLSGKITGIIKEIEDIAFQTNILSLNAAVEAARAGDAGKGFSVVANEIRRLSAKTSEASKSTGELIGQTIASMNHNAQLAVASSEQLLRVADSAQNAADHVEQISRASNDQATAIVQLRESIEQISDVVQENSATAEESAASSEELTAQMQMLKNLVDSFEYNG